MVLIVYVDDIFVTGDNPHHINQLKDHLHKNFETYDLGPIQRYLGVQFDQGSSSLHMHQTQYTLNIIHQSNMEQCAPSHTPLPEGMTLSIDTTTLCVDATLYRMLVGKIV